MSTKQTPQAAAAPAGREGTPDARQLRAILISVSLALMAVIASVSGLNGELGTALGVAMLGALLAHGYRSAIGSRLDGIPTDAADTAREGIATPSRSHPGPAATPRT